MGSMRTAAVVQFGNPKVVPLRSLVSYVHSNECTTGMKVPCPKQKRLTRLLFSHVRGSSRLLQPIHAVDSELNTSVPDLKDIGKTLKNAKVLVESCEGDTINVRVDVNGKETRKVFDDVLTNLTRSVPAMPGFRRNKGGKISNVSKDMLLRAVGEARVIKFVIQEIVSTAMTVYVEEEGLKVKKEFKTIQTAEELESVFEPGKEFWFSATLEVEKSVENIT